MAKSRAAARTSEPVKSPVHALRDCADALFRAAIECCHQHERGSRVHAKSALKEEVAAAQRACEHCDDVLNTIVTAYEQTAADMRPSGEHEAWWHRANALWLASREYLRRQGASDVASAQLKEHGPGQLDALQMEYELEASALLGLRHAADAYKQNRPTAT
jgi:hypothetical protein